MILFALGYLWALPTTLIGLLLAVLGGCFPVGFTRGALWFRATRWSPWRWWADHGFLAITFGGVAIIAEPWVLSSSTCVAHEMRHFWQARILGPLFLPAYGLASLWALSRGRSGYWSNWFEQDARNHE